MVDASGTTVFADTSGQRRLPAWFAPLFQILRRTEIGAMEVSLPDGRVFRAEGAEPGPIGRMNVHDPVAFRRIALGGSLGFSESYVDGLWSTPDLQATLDVAILNNERVARGLTSTRLYKVLERGRHWMRRNTRRQARKNIEAHYDLGNGFYGKWLDPSMTYSSALFDKPGLSLQEAQTRKYSAICDRMALRPDDHVLEIGCGWGGFAEYAARERGARVTGLTISPSQLEFARERVHRAGLSERVTLKLQDYRDEHGRYDRVASIEMFEAVGEKYWPVYFRSVHDRLRPGGRAALQIITIDDPLFPRYRRSVDFIQKHIFPGGMLPSPSVLREQVERAGLRWIDDIRFGDSYSRTLREWSARFDEAWPTLLSATPAARPLDARFQRLWRYYLAICAACFRAKTTDVIQLSLGRD